MLPCDYLLALALLTAPPGSADSTVRPSMYSVMRLPIQAMAVKWEILDPREVRYILARPEDFGSDLNLLRRRYYDLANAPSLVDCYRFPDRAQVNDLLAFNRAYRQHIDTR